MAEQFFINVWQVVIELAPWLLLGGAIAGILHIFMPPNFIQRHLGQGSFSNVVKAVLFGVPMPLCSCGVIPAAVGLKKDGASDGASVGFLISTPQTGIDSIFVSASFLGWPFALFKVFSAFITGLIGGAVVNYNGDGDKPAGASISPGKKNEREKGLKETIQNFSGFVFGDLIYSIWKWLVIGILASAAITTFIPADALAEISLMQGVSGKFIILLFSLGIYVCATASVPIAASLVAAGMPVGSALVFLMAGPATNVATMGTVYRTFGKRVLIKYLAVISVGSIILGQVFDFFFTMPVSLLTHQHHHPGIFTTVIGVGFTGLLGWYAWQDASALLKSHFKKIGQGDQQMTFTVKGMSCQNCANKVKNALMEDSTVSQVEVDLGKNLVNVMGNGLNSENLAGTIRTKGYEVIN